MRDEANFYKTSKLDVIVVVLILFLSVFFILRFAHKRIQESKQPKIALIYKKNNLLEEVNLGENRIVPLLNGKMRIEVKEGKIKVLDSDCPQHICVNMGWIQYSGQTIVCVPNQVLIEVKTKGPSVIDAVAY